VVIKLHAEVAAQNVRFTPESEQFRRYYWTYGSSNFSINVGSSLGARELLTRRDTGHVCK
jgi:hypothetical protein